MDKRELRTIKKYVASLLNVSPSRLNCTFKQYFRPPGTFQLPFPTYFLVLNYGFSIVTNPAQTDNHISTVFGAIPLESLDNVPCSIRETLQIVNRIDISGHCGFSVTGYEFTYKVIND